MLDLEFINNSAPALNAANLNRIVNEINENEKKIKDVQAEVVELVVTHGGSIVQANPEAEKEGTLNKISIDGHVFDFYQENQISDWQVSEDYTWSSQHIKDELDEKADTTVISTLAKDVNADDDIWMYTYTDDPDDIVVSDIVIGTTNAIKKLNQNVNTLAARDSDFKASLNNLPKLAVATPANEEISLGNNTYIKRIVTTINANMDIDTLIDTLPNNTSDVTILQLFANFSNQMRVFGGMFVSSVYNQSTRQLYFRQKYSSAYANGIVVSCVVAYTKS